MSKASVIIELLEEIRRMEDCILYFQNRIARKRIAVTELLAGIDVAPVTGEPEQVKRPYGRFKATKAVKGYLESLNGEKKWFWYDDLTKFAHEQNPEMDPYMIKRNIYEAVRSAIKKGLIRRVPEGFEKVNDLKGAAGEYSAPGV